jgi:hypothetical protein
MAGKAESRLIYNSISTSERVSSLGVKGALLFTWLITHCDCQGRVPGKPVIIKQLVVPFIDEITVENIKEALALMVKRKLIIWYPDSKDRQLIQIVDWWYWQTGLRYKSSSHYEPPPDWQDTVTQRAKGRFSREDEEPENVEF